MQIQYLRLAAAGLVALGLVGCVGLGITHAIVPCPLTYSEQEKELLTVVPKGTRREDALRRLAAAGVEGSFGISRRVYYCELWKRPSGERWHINVALLFDDAGKFYKTQVAEAETAVVPDGKPQAGDRQAAGDSNNPSAASTSAANRAN
jgi:hypothetical protein